MRYAVRRAVLPPHIDAEWDKSPWRDIPSGSLQNYMGSKPAHFPNTEVKMAYDDTAVSVMFRVEDRYVRAVAAEDQDAVCRDSCVEFFFTPGANVAEGYFNLEMNCGGTMLLHFHPKSGPEPVVFSKDDCARVVRAHTLPRTIDPELADPVTWCVEYKIPMALLSAYCRVTRPEPRATWRANFYKCADKTSHPHWLTWAPVEFERPQFHLPDFFGTLTFE